MSHKNKIILTKTISFLIPISLTVGLSCFFFINKNWDAMTFDLWRQNIITWIISYGGTALLFINAFLTAIKAKRILAPILIRNKEVVDTIPVVSKIIVETPNNKRNKLLNNVTFHKATTSEEYLKLKAEMAEYLEKIRKELKM